MLTFACPHCQNMLSTPPDWQGRPVACSHCQQPLTVPYASARQLPLARQAPAVAAQLPPVRLPPQAAPPQPVDASPAPFLATDSPRGSHRSKAMTKRSKQMAGAGLFAGVGGTVTVLAIILKLVSAGVNVSEMESRREKARRAQSTRQVVVPRGTFSPPPTTPAPPVPTSAELQRRALANPYGR